MLCVCEDYVGVHMAGHADMVPPWQSDTNAAMSGGGSDT